MHEHKKFAIFYSWYLPLCGFSVVYVIILISKSNVALLVESIVSPPCRVLYSTTFEELTILGSFPAFYIFNGLLILLQILHYYWFYLICQVARSAMHAGQVRGNVLHSFFISFDHFQVKKDERSDSEDSDDEQTRDKTTDRKRQ